MADRDDSNATRTSAEAAALTVGSAGEDGVKAAAGKAPLATKTKVGISVLAAASLLLIAIAAFALAGGLSAPDGAAQVDGSDSASLSVQSTAGSTGSPDAASDANSQAADSPEGGTSQDDSASQADAPSQTSEGAGQAASAVSADSPSGGNGATASAPAAGNAPASGSTASGSSSQPSTDAPPAQNAVNVSVSVDSSAAGGGVSASGSFSFAPGATPYDALCALGLSVNARSTGYGTYVAAIGGLAEKEHGSQSGWMYSVNGNTPMTACSNYVLSDGDSVVWYYVAG